MDRTSELSLIVKRVVLAACIAAGASVITACQTTEGIGKDVKSLGAGIERSADEHGPADAD